MGHEPSNLSIQEGPDAVHITVSGVISERSELSLTGLQPGRPVVIDGSGVTRINSLGVRAWTLFMKELCQKTPSVAVRQLSPALVTQASMITSFLGCAEVESFVTLWVCPQCDHEAESLQTRGEPLPASLACPSCGAAMELDADPEAYQPLLAG